MVKAIFNNQIIAESLNCVELEGNYYFPESDVKMEFLRKNDHHTTCPWRGLASYFDVIVKGEVCENGAWCYYDPTPKANNIKGHIAFWQEIEIKD